MNYIETKNNVAGKEVKLSYTDNGVGKPVVFIPGWPLSQEMWEYQINELANQGLRCITYDRRGFGRSSKPWEKYDYDTLADDLKAVLDQLNLDHVTLVGFSMGGGEVVRYFTRHLGARVSRVVLISSVTPYLAMDDDNPDGVDTTVFEEMQSNIKEDRIGFLDNWVKQFYSVSLVNHPLSTPLLEYNRTLAWMASPKATYDCVDTFSRTDFRKEMANIPVPVLVIHGDDDKIVPIEASGERTSELISDCRYIVYEDAPHGLFYTHKERLNSDLLNFIMDKEAYSLKEETMPPESHISY